MGIGDETTLTFKLEPSPIDEAQLTKFKARVAGTPSDITPAIDSATKSLNVVFAAAPRSAAITLEPTFTLSVPVGAPQLCTNFGDFKKFFGDFSRDTLHNYLVHAVYGFFNNGGSRCYVMRVKQEADILTYLENLEGVDEIALVAAPGLALSIPSAAISAATAANVAQSANLSKVVKAAVTAHRCYRCNCRHRCQSRCPRYRARCR
jgi:hypothetical protein